MNEQEKILADFKERTALCREEFNRLTERLYTVEKCSAVQNETLSNLEKWQEQQNGSLSNIYRLLESLCADVHKIRLAQVSGKPTWTMTIIVSVAALIIGAYLKVIIGG